MRLVLAAAALAAFVVFTALGSWQLQRRTWKLDLIERVEQRVHAAPVAAPERARWPELTAATDGYRHVRLVGRYLHAQATRVQAATVLGAGHWLLTPLRQADGSVVLVNRGFVPPGWRAPAGAAGDAGDAGDEIVVTGLLRLSEPGGGFLRRNDAAADRWTSRDVVGIARARGLGQVAPYFVDADAGAAPVPDGEGPVGGLTVIRFANNHLVYALTWFALAFMVAGAALWAVRDAHRRRGAEAVPTGERDAPQA
ncbi:SURF1 family protein [Methylibium sp. Pch-M]|uniref:SURF1 family protein n=1 Tax=Methylibium sp. Pch-M TaxID=2082386 RepID=UPI001F5E02D7|nr:SURF1 family protein [Methylibium sp. Pch-M]